MDPEYRSLTSLPVSLGGEITHDGSKRGMTQQFDPSSPRMSCKGMSLEQSMCAVCDPLTHRKWMSGKMGKFTMCQKSQLAGPHILKSATVCAT